MQMSSLRDLFLDELKDLYNAEQQLVKALPKLARAAQDGQLRQAFEEHLEQTHGHVERLERIFEALGKSAKGKRCPGMEGIIAEGSEHMQHDMEADTLDAALILSAQKAEHYEIAGYGSVCAFAKILGEDQARGLLKQTLQEEKAADEHLSDIAESVVNIEAAEGDAGEAEPEGEARATARPRRATQARGTRTTGRTSRRAGRSGGRKR